ncbi:MAG: tripartite tricarboxylate transporter substrate-binding protein [Betaproteobacteria bacterium]|nr:tripartite tricarboxylate transporter substrate-binding protein [Betaproteobacteria bacterium]
MKQLSTAMLRTTAAVGALAVAMTCAMTSVAYAEDYPSRAVKIIQGFAPGGNADTVARVLAQEMTKGLGQPVIVEAKPGAGSTIAADAVAKAAPDGHTLLLVTGGHSVAGALYRKLPYHSVDSFDMISTVTFFPFLVIVRADDAATSLQALIDAARAKPEAVAFGSAGIGATQHLTGELLGSVAGVKFLHVPYKGDSAAMTGLLGGETRFIVAPATVALGQIRAGKLRPLAATGATRWSGMPELPTAAESGLAGFDVRSWMGLATAAGTPRAIIDRLNAEMLRVLGVAAVRKRLEDIGGDPRGSTPAEMHARVENEVRNWSRVIREANIARQ